MFPFVPVETIWSCISKGKRRYNSYCGKRLVKLALKLQNYYYYYYYIIIIITHQRKEKKSHYWHGK